MGTDSKMKVSASLIAIANAGTIDLFGAQRTTEMNTPDAPFCIGCSDATLGQFPWQLSLQTTGHFCGGSILSATALSTAAHCRKSSYYAVAGTIDNQSGQKIQTNVFIGHPQYNGSKIINDFAVGKVTTPFTLNEYAQPIPLVDPSDQRPADGHPLQVSRYLKWTDMEYVSVARCKSIWTGQTIDNSVVCADAPTASICSGDSGGPLVIQEGGEWRLLGLTSWAHVYCRTTGLPQGWANVQWPEYNAWMRENAGL